MPSFTPRPRCRNVLTGPAGKPDHFPHEEVGGVRHGGGMGPSPDQVACETPRREVEQHAGRQPPLRVPGVQQGQPGRPAEHALGALEQVAHGLGQRGQGSELVPQEAVAGGEPVPPVDPQAGGCAPRRPLEPAGDTGVGGEHEVDVLDAAVGGQPFRQPGADGPAAPRSDFVQCGPDGLVESAGIVFAFQRVADAEQAVPDSDEEIGPFQKGLAARHGLHELDRVLGHRRFFEKCDRGGGSHDRAPEGDGRCHL